jgi:hypothetical protein
MSLDHHVVEVRQIGDQLGTTVDVERVAPARDDTEKSDMRVLEDVVEPVHATVSRTFRNREPSEA